MKSSYIVVMLLLSCSFAKAQQSEFQLHQESSNPLDGESLFQTVTKWSQFNDHLTGSDSDQATTQWLGEKLSKVGFQVEFQELTIPLFSYKGAELKVNNQKIACFPIWTPMSTGEAPITAPLVLLEQDKQIDYTGKFVFVEVDQLRMPQFQIALEAVQAGASGLVINYPHVAGVLGAVNSPQPDRPLPVPILLVGNEHLGMLRNEATRKASTSISIMGHFTPQAQTRNIIGKLDKGYDKWIIISTPASGWFDCIGERATGVAVLIGLAEWAAQQDHQVNWMIGVTTGHELDHAGILHLMNSDVIPSPEETIAFISLGASVAAREWKQVGTSWQPLPKLSNHVRLVVSPILSEHVTTAFKDTYKPEITEEPQGGELRYAMEKNYPVIGLFGGHLWFHTVKDDLRTTDPALLQSVAISFSSAIKKILGDN
jgi:hypothetical protein